MRRIVAILLFVGFIVAFFRFAIFDDIFTTAKGKQDLTQTHLSKNNVSDGR